MTAPTLPEGFALSRSPATSPTAVISCQVCHASTACLHQETPHAQAFIRFHQELHV